MEYNNMPQGQQQPEQAPRRMNGQYKAILTLVVLIVIYFIWKRFGN